MKVLLIAGTHGVEPQSVDFVCEFIKTFEPGYSLGKGLELIVAAGISIHIIPCLNHWGLENFSRGNASGVDLNRNLPAQNWRESPKLREDGSANPYYPGLKPCSEAENIFLVEQIQRHGYETLISIHTNHFVANPNPPQINYDGKHDIPGYKLANQMASLMKLPLTEDIGYPTPGSLGSYAKDLGIACITIEFEDELSGSELWHKYQQAFLSSLELRIH